MFFFWGGRFGLVGFGRLGRVLYKKDCQVRFAERRLWHSRHLAGYFRIATV